MAKQEKKQKPRRQVVMVIVEGQSDENALTIPLTEAFEAKYGEEVRVYFARIKNDNDADGGDITSRNGVNPRKIHMLLNKLIIMPCIEEHSLMPKYITEIVHIIDADGVYIDDSHILPPENGMPLAHPFYDESIIRANDPIKLRERNARKRANIDALLKFHREGFPIQNFCDTIYGNKPTTKIHTVPYTPYYFACNLDHFTVNDRNLQHFEKVYSADLFARRHGNSLGEFIQYIRGENAAIKDMSLSESWEFLKLDNNSLRRLTNIPILLISLLSSEVFDLKEEAAS